MSSWYSGDGPSLDIHKHRPCLRITSRCQHGTQPGLDTTEEFTQKNRQVLPFRGVLLFDAATFWKQRNLMLDTGYLQGTKKVTEHKSLPYIAGVLICL